MVPEIIGEKKLRIQRLRVVILYGTPTWRQNLATVHHGAMENRRAIQNFDSVEIIFV